MSQDTAPENPYVGPRPFQKKESARFYGREREARDLLSLVVSERLVLFYAQSGAGKSSLINTRLAPGLEARGFAVMPVGRVNDQASVALPAGNVRSFALENGLMIHLGGVASGQEISEKNAQKLCEESGGWITGIMLSDQTDLPRLPGADAFTYLGKQVLDKQPKALREFLLRTSLPEEFNADLCEATLRPFYNRRQNWMATINALVEKNLFALQVGTDGGWIRYHPLFREFLQARLTREHPEEIEPMLQRLTGFYEGHCEWEKAYFFCQQLNDPERLAQLVERAGTSMLQHAFTTLEAWIGALEVNGPSQPTFDPVQRFIITFMASLGSGPPVTVRTCLPSTDQRMAPSTHSIA